MAKGAMRFGRGLAGGVLALIALATAGCGAPQFTYVADSAASTYFKVPSGWHKIGDAPLATLLYGSHSHNGIWGVAYDASTAPGVSHAFNPASQPFALALVLPLNPAASNAMSYNALRDFMLPVTPAGRQTAMRRGFPLTGFHLLRDTVLTPGQGVHGVRVTFDYTFPGGSADTFDKIALTNSVDTKIYTLLVHCASTCYQREQSMINTVMASFTVSAK